MDIQMRNLRQVQDLRREFQSYSAGGDQQCSALGMGIYEEGDMEVTSGTGAFIIGITEKVPIVLLGNPIINYSAVKRKYIVEASILTCSAAFDWFCNNFYKEVKGDVYQKIDQEIAQSPPGANGCMLLPFFQGRATPQWNPKATASFTNVTLSRQEAIWRELCWKESLMRSAII